MRRGELARYVPPSLAERLARHSKEEDGCLVWTGSRNRDGYGTMRWMGKVMLVHRAAWQNANGSIPSETPLVLHKCDNPPCFKVEHLFLGTHLDNMRDMAMKGRAVRPPHQNRPSKLSEQDVRMIRRLSAEGIRMAELAARYGVTSQTISSTVRGRLHKHVA